MNKTSDHRMWHFSSGTGRSRTDRKRSGGAFPRSDCRRAQALRQGAVSLPEVLEIRPRLPGRARTRLPRGRQARVDLTRVKSTKKTLNQDV